jgi:hypothetical protein
MKYPTLGRTGIDLPKQMDLTMAVDLLTATMLTRWTSSPPVG